MYFFKSEQLKISLIEELALGPVLFANNYLFWILDQIR